MRSQERRLVAAAPLVADRFERDLDRPCAFCLTYAGRSSLFDAVIEPGRNAALIGAIVLEALDLVIDRTHQTRSPRDPRRITSEVE